MASKLPKISISASNAAAFAGLHKYKSSKDAEESVLYSNQWLTPSVKMVKQEILSTKSKEIISAQKAVIQQLIEAPSIPTVSSIPVPEEVIKYVSEVGIVPDIKQDISILSIVPEPADVDAVENAKIIIPSAVMEYYTKVKEAIDVKKEEVTHMKVAASMEIPATLPPDVERYINIERGNVAEVPSLARFKIEGAVVKDEQKFVSCDKFPNFKLIGKLDGSVYNEKGDLIGIIEVKNRKARAFGLDKMLTKDEYGMDSAYDLRQLACYWACKPGLQYYYLLEVCKGELYPLKIEEEMLKKMWEEMASVIQTNCEKLLTAWQNSEIAE